MSDSITAIEEYIASQAVEFQATLRRLRAIIKSEAPDAEELISYQIPSFKYLYMLVGYGATKKGCSFYAMSPGLVNEMSEQLKGQKVSGTTLHLSPKDPVPEALIRQIVRNRIRENEARAAARR